ncbi:MAG: hypothetical protein ACYC2T_14015 [Bacillota bacterium]
MKSVPELPVTGEQCPLNDQEKADNEIPEKILMPTDIYSVKCPLCELAIGAVRLVGKKRARRAMQKLTDV